jgi:hypothetical protein
MSVNKEKRGESSFKVQENSKDITRLCRDLVLRDFGIRKSVRKNPRAVDGTWKKDENGNINICATIPRDKSSTKMTEDAIFLIPEYNDSNEGIANISLFPEWMLDKYRMDVLNKSIELREVIRKANDINIYYPSEYFERRNLQNKALGICDNLVDILQDMTECIPVSIDKIEPLIKSIKDEKRLITAWRKSDNPKLVYAMKNEENRKQAAAKISNEELKEEHLSLSKEQLIKMVLSMDKNELNLLEIKK